MVSVCRSSFKLWLLRISGADQDPFDTDPDPAFQFDTDRLFDTDPDPDPYGFKEVM